MSKSVIPYSIEPYIGYKALKIDRNGMLRSPQQTNFLWPPGKRAEAFCKQQGEPTLVWTLVPLQPGEPAQAPIPAPTSGTNLYGSKSALRPPSGVVTTSSVVFLGVDVQPSEPAPEGMKWDYLNKAHLPGFGSCSCGIYAVSSADQTVGYMGENCVICKVALWGTVTAGSQGARGEFAYPQMIYVPAHLADRAPGVAELYEIPIADELPPMSGQAMVHLSHHVAKAKQQKKIRRMKQERQRREAKQAAISFLALAVASLMLANAIGLTHNIWVAIAPLVTFFMLLTISVVAFIDSRRPIDEL